MVRANVFPLLRNADSFEDEVLSSVIIPDDGYRNETLLRMLYTGKHRFVLYIIDSLILEQGYTIPVYFLPTERGRTPSGIRENRPMTIFILSGTSSDV